MGFSFDDFISDLTHQFSSSVTPTESEKNAGSAGNQARATADAQNAALSKDFHGSYLPEVVSAAMENFDGMSHDRIIQYRDSVRPSDMGGDVTSWNKLAATAFEKADSFRGDIEALINNGWAGAAADSAKNSVRQYAENTKSLQLAAQLVANKLSDGSATLTQVKNQIPDKPKSRATSLADIVTDVVSTAVGGEASAVGGQIMADHGRTSNAQNEAREVMKNVYAKYLPEADRKVPKMPGVTAANAPGGASGPTNTVSPASAAPSYSTHPTTSHYGPSASAGASTSHSSSPASTSPSNYGGSSGSRSNPNLPTAMSGNSVGPSGPSSSYSPSTTTAGYSPSGTGTTGTTGSGGFDSPTGGVDSSTGGGKGASVPGTRAGTTPAAAAAANAAKSTAGLTGSMMPHGQGKRGEDDAEHKTADYLRGVQEDLIGPEPRLLPGGVIGGDYADE